MRCFAHFHLQMCFAPQPRAIFEHRNFQNGSANVVFCAFWLATVLRATAACNFSTSELQKVLRHRQFFTIFTCTCAFRHSRVPFFTCPLHSYLRTRRFSEATFRTSGTTNHWKNTAIRDVPNIFHTCTFFQVTLHACASPWSWLDICCVFDTSTLLFNSAYCRKLDFKTSFDDIVFAGHISTPLHAVHYCATYTDTVIVCACACCLGYISASQTGVIRCQHVSC